MYGLVIPSLLQQNLAARQKSLAGLIDDDPFLKRIGNGMAVDRMGRVVVTKRATPPTQMEAEDMQALLQKFADYLRSETGADIIGKAAYGEMVTKATDPVVAPQPYASPADFANEFGVPVDTTEIIALCEELGLYNALPEVVNGSNTESWRELTAINFTSGANYVAFEAGGCPEEHTSASTGRTVAKKHIGAKKTLSESDIVHSMASIAAGYGMREMVGAVPSNIGFGEGVASFTRQSIASVKEMEIRRQMVLILNGWDELLVKGSSSANTEEFDGFETILTGANGVRVNPSNAAYSGSFTAARFDEFLAAGCAKPTHLFGHQTALQAVKLGYWGLGAISNGGPAQIMNYDDGTVVPGLTFAQAIDTSVGRLPLIPDSRFTRVDNGDGSFNASVFGLRMTHNGEPLVYKGTQIPLSYKDLAPGCSAISFQTWAVTSLVIKHLCAHFKYTAKFAGLVGDGCSYVNNN